MLLTTYGKKEWELITVILWPLILIWIAAGIFIASAGYAMAVLFFLFWLAGVSFFRDPERKIADFDHVLYSPADGVVRDIELISASDCEEIAGIFEGKDMLRIGISLSVFDVHINRVPCPVKIQFRKHQDNQGKGNESMLLAGIANAGGRDFPFALKQISNGASRQIVCEPVPGDSLKRGERYGMIKYGSRVELFLPAKSDLLEIKVRVGDRVQAGLSVIAEFSQLQK